MKVKLISSSSYTECHDFVKFGLLETDFYGSFLTIHSCVGGVFALASLLFCFELLFSPKNKKAAAAAQCEIFSVSDERETRRYLWPWLSSGGPASSLWDRFKVGSCHDLAANDSVRNLGWASHGVAAAATTNDQLTNHQKWHGWRFILALWRRFTRVAGCGSVSVFIVRPAHGKLHVEPKFIRSVSFTVACCELTKLLKKIDNDSKKNALKDKETKPTEL